MVIVNSYPEIHPCLFDRSGENNGFIVVVYFSVTIGKIKGVVFPHQPDCFILDPVFPGTLLIFRQRHVDPFKLVDPSLHPLQGKCLSVVKGQQKGQLN